MKKNFITGFIADGIICATVTGIAVEYAVAPNAYPVYVDGQTAEIEGYNINDSTYFKLRDIGDKVGFRVDFANDLILVNTAPTPMPTPTPTVAPLPSLAPANISIVKGEDGDYTSDGLKITYVDDVAYVTKGYIMRKIEKNGINGYSFSTSSFIKAETDGYKSIVDNVPLCPVNSQLIPVEFYISTLAPIVNSLK